MHYHSFTDKMFWFIVYCDKKVSYLFVDGHLKEADIWLTSHDLSLSASLPSFYSSPISKSSLIMLPQNS